MKDVKERILDVAIELAEEGGFENVRQRDVAAKAGVALGTLYKRFRSKEEILCAALEREATAIERRMDRRPAKGDTVQERLTSFYRVMTKAMCKKPNFSRAVLRAMASGEPEVAGNVAAYHGRINALTIAAIRGVGTLSFADAQSAPPTEREFKLAFLLQHIWFAALVGWGAGLATPTGVVEQMDTAAQLLIAGLGGEI